MYKFVEYQKNGGYPLVLFYSAKDGSGALTGDGHLIPMQAIANRMELLGLESVEQTLEYIGREFHDRAMSDGLHDPMQTAYASVAQDEFQVVEKSHGPLPTVLRQTALARVAINPTKREHLSAVRSETLEKLGMRSRIHSEPMLRVHDASRPVERTRPAAAEALGATNDCLAQAVSEIQQHMDEIERWRVETVVAAVPAMRNKLG